MNNQGSFKYLQPLYESELLKEMEKGNLILFSQTKDFKIFAASHALGKENKSSANYLGKRKIKKIKKKSNTPKKKIYIRY